MVAGLNVAGIPYMLTGSFAAAVHGAGRATMDIDFVIDPTLTQLHVLIRALDDPTLYLSVDAAVEAHEHATMFNVIETGTGWKADLIIRKPRDFSRTEFARRQPVEFDGTQIWTATQEDLIVAKLEWHQSGASARQLDDVVRLLQLAADTLDVNYVTHWVGALGLDAEWQAARIAAGRL
jgi:hypothetical protein